MTNRTRGTAAALRTWAAAALLLAGCGIDADDLARWKDVRGGVERLTGYMAAPERPLELRVRAARYLFEADAPGQLVYVFQHAEAEDRAELLEPFLLWLGPRFLDEDPAVVLRAKDTFYQLMPLAKELPAEAVQPVLDRFVDWALTSVLEAKPGPGRPVEQVLIASGLLWPGPVLAPILKAMRGTEDVERLSRLAKLGETFADVPGRLAMAGALLEAAKRSLPALPETMVAALASNGNETLMRFLLDVARDPEVALAIRVACVQQAVVKLGARATEGLEALLRAEDPLTENALRFVALAQLLDVRGPKHLRAILEALPVGSGWPDEGAALREAIDRFCDEAVAPKKGKARKALLATLEVENPLARTFAAECVVRLFPDEAKELLLPLAKDKTPLHGFGGDLEKPPVLGDLARGKLGE